MGAGRIVQSQSPQTVGKGRGDEKGITTLAQHIPEKSFQLVRYFGWYSNRRHRPSITLEKDDS
ncbi:transposase [Desulfocapsa sulfexigens]|uniref:transposase n=1 Tax=Desulfocapsa sulfexigens TaxID=65555 RepID=UPI001427D5D3